MILLSSLETMGLDVEPRRSLWIRTKFLGLVIRSQMH